MNGYNDDIECAVKERGMSRIIAEFLMRELKAWDYNLILDGEEDWLVHFVDGGRKVGEMYPGKGGVVLRKVTEDPTGTEHYKGRTHANEFDREGGTLTFASSGADTISGRVERGRVILNVKVRDDDG